MKIVLTGPKTVTLSPENIAVILDALSEKPLKVAYPAFMELTAQLETPTDGTTEQPS